jgi:uncharacterized membrane protein (UPF0127 family)
MTASNSRLQKKASVKASGKIFSVVFNLILFFSILSPISCNERLRPVRFGHRELTIQKADGSAIALGVDVAETARQRERGLMYRDKLPEGGGMLFVFEKDQILSFWMKNTKIPLSIAYISSDGRIIEIKDMEKESTITVVSSRSARYALEVPRGWFNRAGIRPGDRLKL